MPDAPNISALYPRPPENSLGSLTLPALVNTAQGVTSLEQYQREMGANIAFGNALRGAIDPATGLVRVPEASRAFAADPRSNWGPVAERAVNLAQQQNAAQYAVQALQNNYIRDSIGSYLGKPNLTKQDVIDLATRMRAQFPSIPTSTFTSYINDLPDDPKALRAKVIDLANMVRGSTGVAAPAVTGYAPGGQPITGPTGAQPYEMMGVGAGQLQTGGVPTVTNVSQLRALGLRPGQPFKVQGSDKTYYYYPDVTPGR